MADIPGGDKAKASKVLYVGNLPFKSSQDDIRTAFAEFGEVFSIKLIRDRLSGRPRGFGFVRMDPTGADEAILALNAKEFGGRKLRIEEAKDQAPPRKTITTSRRQEISS